VANIGQFGDLQAVGQRLLDAERKKVRVGQLHACTRTGCGRCRMCTAWQRTNGS
jgi:hypothetical protein